MKIGVAVSPVVSLRAIVTALFNAGVKIAVLGDSIFARSNSSTTSGARTTIENRSNGELHWCQFADPRFLHTVWWDNTATAANRVPTFGDAMAADTLFSGANFGYSGDTATGTNKRVSKVIASGASICVYNAGTNVGSTDATAATTISAIQDTVADLVAGGVSVILGTVRPRRVVGGTPTGTDISPASMQRIRDINTSIRANWRTWGAAALWDPWEVLRDQQYTTTDSLYGTCNENYFIDGVHLNPRGAYYSALTGPSTLLSAIQTLVGAGKWFNADATVSNILSNGRFTGTSGTANNGMSGTMPSNWFISNVAGAGQPVTGTASLENNSETGGQNIVLALTSTGAGGANTFGTLRLSATNPTTGFTSTDYVSALFEVEVTGSAVLPMMQATLGQTSTIAARGMGQTTASYNTEPLPLIDGVYLNGWIRTEPLLVEARTSLNPRLDIILRNDLAGSVTVRVKRAILRVVPDPATQFAW